MSAKLRLNVYQMCDQYVIEARIQEISHRARINAHCYFAGIAEHAKVIFHPTEIGEHIGSKSISNER